MDNEELQENLDAEVQEGVEPTLAENEADFELAKAGGAVKDRRRASEDEDMDDGEGQLTIDLYQTPDEIVLESPIAGVKSEDLDISITNESVTITGRREKERRVKDEDYFYQETYWGKFARSIILPQEVDAEKSEATIKNGVLTIRLPKLNRQRSKKLKVQSSE